MGEKWESVYCSSSLANFKSKLKRKFNLPDWHWLWYRNKPALFVGLYSPRDYVSFLWHGGTRTVFWGGSDIRNLLTRPRWRKRIQRAAARHICENNLEYNLLKTMGIIAEVRPSLLDVIDAPLAFKSTLRPHVYLCAHPGREKEYGVDEFEDAATLVPNVIFHIYGIDGLSRKNVVYHGDVPHEQFQQEIERYQAAVRLNAFDGFSEIVGRSVLMGQYPISRIEYPHIDHAPDFKSLVYLLGELKYKRDPNYIARAYWQLVLLEPLSG